MKYLIIILLVSRCGESPEAAAARRKAEKWNEPYCTDTSTLLATTSGSPSEARCEHKRHRMRVQVATHPSNEEAAALIFCECQR